MEPLQPVLDRVAFLLSTEGREEAEAMVHLLGSRVRAIQDRMMRVTAIRTTLASLDDGGLLATFHLLLEGARGGRSPHREVLQELSLDPDLFKDMGYDRHADLYRAARLMRLEGVARWFLGDSHRWNITAEEAVENEFLPLASGIRKTYARSSDRFKLDRVLHDRHPGVIQNLLENPRIVERDVVRIAAARPTRPEILRMIAEHPRWSARYQVRKAVVCNPWCPESVAIRMMPNLLQQDLVFVARATNLSERVREAARQFLHVRDPGGASTGH